MSLDTNSGFKFFGDSTSGTITKNTVTNIDYKITEDDIYISGAELIYQGAVWGDYVAFQVVDIDNILGYGANTVLNEYVSKWYLHPSRYYKGVQSPYAANVPKNLYLRLKYTSVGLIVNPTVAINFSLHKVI